MNGNTPDQAELRGNIENILNAEYACPKCGWYHQLTNNDHKSTTDQLLALFAQQPSSQAIERASISDTLFALKEIKHSDYSRELIDFKIKTLEEDLKARLTKPNETGSKV